MESVGQKRRLATIMAADVVGYSKLVAEDEEAAVARLRSYREIIDRLIERHDGRIFNTAGDSVLTEFTSVVEAVRCAIAIQDELRVRNTELVAVRQMQFRIGINVGDVLVVGDDLLGDGVNVAARLEGLAPPGGIYISGSTFEQVKNKLSIGFEDLGPQQLKNIPESVSAFGITSAPVSVQSGTTAAMDRPSHRLASGGIRKMPLALGATLAVVLVASAIGYWIITDPSPTSLASLPENISTDEMRADQIEVFLTGMKIEGRRKKDGQPFSILLKSDKTAFYEYARSGVLAGTRERINGKWRTEDYRFCMQLRQFASGREICPRIVKTGETVSASRRDGSPLTWSLNK